MSTNKAFDKICCVVLVATLLLTFVFINSEKLGVQKNSQIMGYESKLFDTSKVHSINIIMDDWDTFIKNCQSEEYYDCTVVIDNDAYKNVAIRGKGNTSLTQVASYGNNRYSFKIEFDHYDKTNTYYGLDKLCLNNIIQDNTYLKDYLTYQMMAKMGVASPLCSFVYVTVNGEDWGLYLALEGVEESFLQRNYGKDYGELYKPDSMNMGGGRGNGKGFDLDDFLNTTTSDNTVTTTESENAVTQTPSEVSGDSAENGQMPEMPSGDPQQNGKVPQMPSGDTQNGQVPQMPGGDAQNGQVFQMPGTGTQNGDVPQMPDENTQNGQMPQMPDENIQNGQMPDMSGDMIPPNDMPEMSGDSTQTTDNTTQNVDTKSDTKTKNHGMLAGSNGSDDVLLKYTDDEFDSYSNIFDNAKTDITNSDKTRLINSLKNLTNNENLSETVDIESVIRYFVVHNFVLNFDSYTGSMIHNYYLYEKDGQMQMIPWDYNLAFGGFQSMGGATSLVNYPIDSPISGGNTEDRPMIAWIFSNDDYTELYHKYFSEFIEEYFDSGYFAAMIDEVYEMISPYVEKDPTKFCTFDEFEKGVNTLKEFCLLRAESVSAQLDGTIGSTSSTQKSDTLIDAGDIQISDMGSMNNSFGGTDKSFDRKNDKSSDDNFNLQNDSSKTENSTIENKDSADKTFDESSLQTPKGEDKNNSNEDESSKGETDKNRTKPNGTMPDRVGSSAESIVLLAVSLVVLALGLVFAKLFKRRQHQ